MLSAVVLLCQIALLTGIKVILPVNRTMSFCHLQSRPKRAKIARTQQKTTGGSAGRLRSAIECHAADFFESRGDSF
jgi:hypothetical protein